MTTSYVDRFLYVAAIAVTAHAAHRTREIVSGERADVAILPQRGLLRSVRAVVPRAQATSDAAGVIVGGDMFRLSNSPAQLRYDAHADGASTASMPAFNRPRLTLKAIVGGPPWQAVIDGLPGVSATVLRVGDAVGALTVRSVSRDTVVVQGMDTTWKLTFNAKSP